MISRIHAFAARLLLVLLLAFAGGHAMAAGSLAIDTLQGEKYGFSFNHPSTDQADQRAMRECGADCSVVLRFRAECGAYAADQAKGSNAYGWATGATSSIVQQRAQAECRSKGGSSCKVRAWGCDATKAAAQEVAPRDVPAARDSVPSRDNTPPRETPAARGEFPMQGEWLVDYAGSAGFPYNGTLRVSEKLGNGMFRGVMVLAYTTNDGKAKRVQQDVQVTVRGNTVVIQGSNPVYLQGSGNYSADAYTVTIASNNLMRGTNNDADGAGGAVVISRR
ncbi:MAG: DUF4189 domain-containing protein [Pseudomonadota bacterium]|uniref:DUF4189 domain-containing protein n=1 Tax=Polaromonas sp. TaxID=1869339 RepID=UPI00183DC157|nr:DUF4189 domain-containing protein [Polaromonas sp.]MBA3594533.1 DUF4189 domain-containing protein [Polaromonas sp.]MDQ3272898.1 DUF4189 domain-containing protein [Pseudomonadota bacterium]